MNKKQFEKELEEIKEKRFKDYEANFNDAFETKVKFRDKDIPSLKIMAEQFIWNDYKATKIYRYLSKKSLELEEMLFTTLTEEQRKIYDLIDYVENEKITDMSEQSFVFGFVLAKNLSIESDKYAKKHNI